MTNLAENLITTAETHAAATALRLADQQVTYADLDEQSARVAGLLRERGVTPGDRVGIMLPNVPQFAACYYGILRAGGVVVPMNVLLKQRETHFYLGDSGAKVILVWHGFADAATTGADQAGAECILVDPATFEDLLQDAAPIAEVAPRDGQDTAVILYTSGTTGTPKGAELTHANLSRNAAVVRDIFTLTDQDVVFGALPLFHSFGQTCTLNATIASGARLEMIARFDPAAALELIGTRGVTVFMGVPTMYTALLGHRDAATTDASSLRLCVSGGSALPVEVLRGFESTFGCNLLEGYGLSETSPVACFNHLDNERTAGSIGTPIDGVQMRVVDPDRKPLPAGEIGEIAIRGHNVMKGYWNRPDATAETIDPDGWFYSGDLARVDEHGRYFIVDRKKELIIRGGYNVYPREIEEVLYEHPAVREAAVIGVPDDLLGEEVGAAIALKPGADITPADLKAFVKDQVAAYKYPRHIWLVDELPKGATGKILKREITVPSTTTTGGAS